MEKDTLILAIAGISISVAFLGFLAYLSFLSRRQEPPIYVDAVSRNPAPNSAPQQIQEKVVETREVSPRKPHIINFHLNDAGRWYKIDIQPDTVSWTMKARGSYPLNYSYEPSHSTHETLAAGERLMEDTMPNREIRAVYVMCETAGVVAELEVWR